ncbi:MAG: hypothetical protein WC813_03100 [Patescibacteria group bacterium]
MKNWIELYIAWYGRDPHDDHDRCRGQETLNFYAEPLPFHERTLDRIRHLAMIDFDFGENPLHADEPPDEERVIIQEIAFRVVGSELPTPNGDTSIPEAYVEALLYLRNTCHEKLQMMIDDTIWWLLHTYRIGN